MAYRSNLTSTNVKWLRYTVKQNKNFISTTFQEKNHSLNLEKKYMQHWYYNIIFTWIS